MTPHPLHARLRAATGPLHARLDTSLAIAREPLSAELVARHLGACFAFYEPVEKRVHEVAGDCPHLATLGLQERSKVARLRADLVALGIDAASARCTELPTVERPDDCWGVLYVLEGATLGGRVLQTRIGDALPTLRPLQFFAGYGAATGVRWRGFLDALDEAHRAGSIDESRAESAALATFATFATWLERRGCSFKA